MPYFDGTPTEAEFEASCMAQSEYDAAHAEALREDYAQYCKECYEAVLEDVISFMTEEDKYTEYYAPI